jgi:hypothetical protein
MNTTVEGQWTWDDTCAVMKDLRASGVECGESVGGVWIMFDLESQGMAVVSIVKRHKGRFCSETFMERLTMESADRVIREREVAQLERLWRQ